jgi:hypothetical protein
MEMEVQSRVKYGQETQGNSYSAHGIAGCYALLRMRPLSISWAECSVVISCGKVDHDKSG